MAAVEIGVGAAWMALGAAMVWSGLFDKSVVPAGLWRALKTPAVIAVGAIRVMRFALRTAYGARSRKTRPSH